LVVDTTAEAAVLRKKKIVTNSGGKRWVPTAEGKVDSHQQRMKK
jgi:hypothetical protein